MRLLPRFRPRADHLPRSTPPAGPAVQIRWLGTAGHVVSTARTTVLLDPFLTRPSLRTTATRPLAPEPEQWWGWLPERIDAVLVGHSHYDHLMDAPLIARETGALIAGSRTTASFAAGTGVAPQRIITVPPQGMTFDVGDVRVRFVPSQHARISAGHVPFEGEVTLTPRLPARVWRYRMGGAFGIHLTTPGPTVYHNGSADLVDAALAGTSADVALVGLAGRQVTRRYVERLFGLIQPSLVVPTHHDLFFAPLEEGVRLLPGVDLSGFDREVRQHAPGARLLTPTYEDVLYVPMDAPAGDVVAAPL